MKTHWLNTVPEFDSSSRDSEGTNKIKGTVNRFTKSQQFVTMLNVEFDDRALFYFFSNFDLFCKFYL